MWRGCFRAPMNKWYVKSFSIFFSSIMHFFFFFLPECVQRAGLELAPLPAILPLSLHYPWTLPGTQLCPGAMALPLQLSYSKTAIYIPEPATHTVRGTLLPSPPGIRKVRRGKPLPPPCSLAPSPKAPHTPSSTKWQRGQLLTEINKDSMIHTLCRPSLSYLEQYFRII